MRLLEINYMGQYLKIYWIFFKTNVAIDLTYKLSAIFFLLEGIAHIVFAIVFFDAIYAGTETLAGWSEKEVLVLIGTYILVDAMAWLTFRLKVLIFGYEIRKGTMDFNLTKPVDAQFLSSIGLAATNDLIRFIIAIGIIIFAIYQLDIVITFGGILLYILSICLGLMIYYCFIFLFKLLAFVTVDASGVDSFVFAVVEGGKFPTDIYKGVSSYVFTVFIPFAFMFTFPVKILFNPNNIALVVYSAVFTFILWMTTRVMWKRLVKNYTSASS